MQRLLRGLDARVVLGARIARNKGDEDVGQHDADVQRDQGHREEVLGLGVHEGLGRPAASLQATGGWGAGRAEERLGRSMVIG